MVMESEWELSHPVLAIGNHKDCHFKFNKHELRCKCYKRSNCKFSFSSSDHKGPLDFVRT